MKKRFWKAFRAAIRHYFVAGLLAFVPIGVTLWTLAFIVRRLDNLLLPTVIRWFFPSLPEQPDLPPLVGAVFTFVVILLVGVIVRHLFGHEIVRIGERLVARVPIARSIYQGVKQLVEAILASSDAQSSFNRVVLVEYPRVGMWGIAFVTGPVRGPLREAFSGTEMISCFIPTTPNPTSGFYLLVPEAEVREIDMSIENAFKVIMSGGLVMPEESTRQRRLPGLEA